ncbi:MAG: T9SS type A sorting domain-containing protein [Bacteroidota bacterium]
MKKLLLFSILFFFKLASFAQSTESFTLEVQPSNSTAYVNAEDLTVDDQGNIYLLIREFDGDGSFGQTVISKYHPVHGLQWSKIINEEINDIVDGKLLWSKLGDLVLVGRSLYPGDLAFLRISNQGQITAQKFFASENNIIPTKIQELATGDLIIQTFSGDGLIRIDANGNIQNTVHVKWYESIIDFHVTRNNEIYVFIHRSDAGVHRWDNFICQFDHRLQLQQTRRTDIFPANLSENSNGEPVLWYPKGNETFHLPINMYSNIILGESHGIDDTPIHTARRKAYDNSVVAAADDGNLVRFYKSDHQSGQSYFEYALELPQSVTITNELTSFELSNDKRIIALLQNKNTYKNKAFYLSSSRMNYQPGCLFRKNQEQIMSTDTVRLEEGNIEFREIEIQTYNGDVTFGTTALNFKALCSTNCEIDPPAPPIEIILESDWRYGFSVSGELDPTITGFYWSVNGQVVGEGPEIDYNIEHAGHTQVCLTITTPCGGKTVCKDIYRPARRNWMDSPSQYSKVWPNPVEDQLNINLEHKSIQSLTLYNALGQNITANWENNGRHRIILQTAALPRGQYTVALVDQNGLVETVRFTK